MMKGKWMMAALLGGMLFLNGCKDSDKDDSPAPAAASAPASAPSPAAAPAATPSANEQFAAITPSELKMVNKFILESGNMMYVLECKAISGAKTYTFTTSYGFTYVYSKNTGGVLRKGLDDDPFTFSVYATNEDGFNTKTASKKVN